MRSRASGALLALPTRENMRPRHRVLLGLEITVSYIPLAWGLHRRNLPELLAVARRPRGPRVAVRPDEQHETAVRLGHVVGAVLEWLPFDSRCLIRSLVLVRILSRRSIDDAALVIGASVEGGFAAHAWVEHDGEPVLPTLSHPTLIRL